MLTIRKQQLEALAADADRAFVQRECERLARIFAGAMPVPDPALLPDWVDTQVERALRYRICAESDVEDYLDLCVVAPDLASGEPRPRLQQIFEDRALPAFRKIRLAQNEVLFSTPEEVTGAGHE